MTYKVFTISSFISGYLIVLKSVHDTQLKDHMVSHLEELMEDTDAYGWDKVRGFHAAWMNQMEQCRCEWGEEDQKLKMKRALILLATMNNKGVSIETSKGAEKKTDSTANAYHVPAKPGTETCKDFNYNRCFKDEHPE